jgi:DNA-binding winged helix-turn-helix (wHTH) protein/tetratricopeptide (TPR) repeat protein
VLTQTVQRRVRFGPYEADFRRGELRKFGTRIRIQGKPLAVLALLVKTPGQTVLREELRDALWTDDVFVDFDKNLATAVNKLRQALCDTAESPQYIETVPKVGYRFIAPVEVLSSDVIAEPLPTDVVAAAAAPAVVAGAAKKGWRRWIFATAFVFTAILIVILVAAISEHRRPAPALSEKDSIIVADFANGTSEPLFNDTLKTGLTLALDQSPYLNVLSEAKVAKTLKLMTKPPNTKLSADVVREVCLRTESKAYVAGSITSLGTDYVLALKAVDCKTGETLGQQQVTAERKEKVLNALGKAAANLRSQLGESLATVQRFDAPLAEVTTQSLEALQAYSQAPKAGREEGPEAQVVYLQHAIALDPNFARAYAAMGNTYESLSETGRAAEYYSKAFELREHATEREKLVISGRYYQNVTGELDKAARTYEEVLQSYPRDVVIVDLANIYAAEGKYDEAVEVMRQSQRLVPDRASVYTNLANAFMALQRFDEARQVIQQGQSKKLENLVFHNALYALSFLKSDAAGMAKQQEWFAGKPDVRHFGFSLASDTEAYAGHLNKARELTRRAVESAIQADSKENAAIWSENAALREAAFGNAEEARRDAAAGLKLTPDRQDVQVEAALAYAMAGDKSRAQSLADELGRRYPVDTQMQSLWLPAVQAQLALLGKDSAGALDTLQKSAPPIEYGQIGFLANLSCLPWTYARGQALLASGQAGAAATEFQKISDHTGVVWNCWTGALARLGLARANALQSKQSQGADADAARVRALAAYREFFGLWKEADPDIPVYKQAQAEYARLQ